MTISNWRQKSLGCVKCATVYSLHILSITDMSFPNRFWCSMKICNLTRWSSNQNWWCTMQYTLALLWIFFDWKTFGRVQNSLNKCILSIACVAQCIIAIKMALSGANSISTEYLMTCFHMFFIIHHNSLRTSSEGHPGTLISYDMWKMKHMKKWNLWWHKLSSFISTSLAKPNKQTNTATTAGEYHEYPQYPEYPEYPEYPGAVGTTHIPIPPCFPLNVRALKICQIRIQAEYN